MIEVVHQSSPALRPAASLIASLPIPRNVGTVRAKHRRRSLGHWRRAIDKKTAPQHRKRPLDAIERLRHTTPDDLRFCKGLADRQDPAGGSTSPIEDGLPDFRRTRVQRRFDEKFECHSVALASLPPGETGTVMTSPISCSRGNAGLATGWIPDTGRPGGGARLPAQCCRW